LNDFVLIIDKPEGPTSFDICRRVKEIFPAAKVGHAGSLDPFATGVLVIMVGRATKLSQALLTADKTYLGTMTLGSAMDTMDKTGQVMQTKPVPETLTFDTVNAGLKSFEGIWMQTPPMFSAKKIRGVRLYDLARESIHVRRSPIPVNIYETRLIRHSGAEVEFEVSCSKGTYIRGFADELARRLDTVGHLSTLRRLSCGFFTIEEAISLETLASDPEGCAFEGQKHLSRLIRFQRSVKLDEGDRQSFANTF